MTDQEELDIMIAQDAQRCRDFAKALPRGRAFAEFPGVNISGRLFALKRERDEWEEMFGNVASAVCRAAGLDDSHGWDEAIAKIRHDRAKQNREISRLMNAKSYPPGQVKIPR